MREDIRGVREVARYAVGPDPARRLWPGAAEAAPGWEELLALSQEHRVVGFLHRALEETGGGEAPPAQTAARIEAAWRRQKIRTVAHLAAYREVLHAFRAHGIPNLLLKGVDLAQRLYPDPGLRPFQDLDVLLRASDLDAAIRILGEHGYERPSRCVPPALMRRFHFHLPLVHRRRGAFVELHWALADHRAAASSMGYDDLRDRTETNEFGDHVLPDALAIVYLSAHADRHGAVNPWIADHPRADELICHPHSGNRLIWFVDIARLRRRGRAAPDEIARAAAELGAETAVSRVLGFCDRLTGPVAASPPAPESSAPPAGRWADRARQRLVRDMVRDLDGTEPLDRPLPMAWRTNHQLHLRPIRLLLSEPTGAPSA